MAEDHPFWLIKDGVAYLQGLLDGHQRSQSVETFESSAASDASDESGTLRSDELDDEEGQDRSVGLPLALDCRRKW